MQHVNTLMDQMKLNLQTKEITENTQHITYKPSQVLRISLHESLH